jgi:CHAD domain-containing protein
MSSEEKKDVEAEPAHVGPLGAIASHGAGDLRAALVTAFRDAIADARAAAALPKVEDAVHECRKALRRARATARLVATSLGRDDRRDLRRALRDARRLLSTARDVAVLPGALAALDVGEELHGAVVAIVSAGRAAAPPSDETRKLVEEAATRVAPLADVMAAALPAELDWDDLADGLATTYKAARRAVRTARRSHSSFHTVRRRSKELAAQLELLAGGTDGKTAALRKQLADLGDELGDTVDEIMLRDFVEANGADAALLDTIDAHLDRRMRSGRKAARGVFDRRARRFVRKVGKAVKKDHAPPEPPPASAN